MNLKLSAHLGKPSVKYLSDDVWQGFVNETPGLNQLCPTYTWKICESANLVTNLDQYI